MRQFAWLIALEAGLFFSLTCWEITATFSNPTYYPWDFAAKLLAAVTAATLACHVCPAMYAARFPVPFPVLAWAAIGYSHWLWTMGDFVNEVAKQDFGIRFPLTIPFLLAIATLAYRKPIWKPELVIGFFIAAVVLCWVLATQWHGIWATNRYVSNEPVDRGAGLIRGILLLSAPAAGIGWYIGKSRPKTSTIWGSALLGLWLPAVVAIPMASVAADAGTRLYWVPSLPGGFNWALLGSGSLNRTALVLAESTLILPALLAALVLWQIHADWSGRPISLLAVLLIGAAIHTAPDAILSWIGQPDGWQSLLLPPLHQVWAWSLLALGAVASLRLMSVNDHLNS